MKKYLFLAFALMFSIGIYSVSAQLENSKNSKTQVEKFLQENWAVWEVDLRSKAKEKLGLEFPDPIPEKSEFSGIEIYIHDIENYGKRVQKFYKEGDYERALRIAENTKRAYEEGLALLEGAVLEAQEAEAARREREALDRQNQETEKAYEAEQKAQQQAYREAKKKEQKKWKAAMTCVLRYMRFKLQKKYMVTTWYGDPAQGDTCPALYIRPKTAASYWDDEGRTIFTDEQSIKIIARQDNNSTEGSFAKESIESGAKAQFINGQSWYYLNSSQLNPELAKGDVGGYFELYSTYKGGFEFSIESSGGIRSKDFLALVKTVRLNPAPPGKIEPVGVPTGEKLALQGSWELIETFFPDDPIGYPPVKKHRIAFNLQKICSFIQEETPNKCYTKYVPYELKEKVLTFKESSTEYRWEILENTASRLEILEQNGARNIYRKVSI